MRDPRQSGQILVLAALIQVIAIALIGFAADYGVMLVTQARLQNAADAASLAAAHALVAGSAPGPTAARAEATRYLDLHGYRVDPTTTIGYTVLPSAAGRPNESFQIDVARRQPTFFIRVLGMNEVSLSARAVAEANRTMVDIMLSLDLTGSMELSGTSDLANLRRAVVQFIGQFNLNPADARGAKIGVARFAGVMCRWRRANGSDTTLDLAPSSEYVTPCTDDKTVISDLTQSSANLIRIADGTGGGSCPGGMAIYACPLVSWKFDQVQLTTGAWAAPLSLRVNGSTYMNAPVPHYTGTKLPNAITVVSNAGYYAWDTAHGGRNDPAGTGNARKVLVVMTDGNNELWPDQGNPAGSVAGWDAEVVTRANTLKLGPDGAANTLDDVEIYTVGFYCTPYSTGGTGWCSSRMAAASPHPCPGTYTAAQASATDQLLISVSSSTPGTCDHYFPIRKTEDLPQLFTVLAGNIARGRLTG